MLNKANNNVLTLSNKHSADHQEVTGMSTTYALLGDY